MASLAAGMHRAWARGPLQAGLALGSGNTHGLKVGVDGSCCLGRLGALADLPAPHLEEDREEITLSQADSLQGDWHFRAERAQQAQHACTACVWELQGQVVLPLLARAMRLLSLHASLPGQQGSFQQTACHHTSRPRSGLDRQRQDSFP